MVLRGLRHGAGMVWKDRDVPATADGLQAVVAELNLGHWARVPPQRALPREPDLWLARPVHEGLHEELGCSSCSERQKARVGLL